MYYVKCVLLFSLRIYMNSAKHYHRCIWVFTQKQILIKLKFSRQILIKVPNTKFRRSLCGGSRVFPCGMTASNHHTEDTCSSSSRRYYVTCVT